MTTAVQGSDVQIDFSFYALGSTTELVDPDVVTVTHRNDMLVETTYTYGVDDEIERLSEGLYRFTIQLTTARHHKFRCYGDGNVHKPQEFDIEVTESSFSDPTL